MIQSTKKLYIDEECNDISVFNLNEIENQKKLYSYYHNHIEEIVKWQSNHFCHHYSTSSSLLWFLALGILVAVEYLYTDHVNYMMVNY